MTDKILFSGSSMLFQKWGGDIHYRPKLLSGVGSQYFHAHPDPGVVLP